MGPPAAGPRLAQAGAGVAPCLPGGAVATPAFDLEPPVRHVIHDGRAARLIDGRPAR